MWRPQISVTRGGEGVAAAEVVGFLTPSAIWRATWSLWWRWVARIAVLLATDIVGLLLAAACGYLLWAYWILDQPLALYMSLCPLLGLFPLGYAGAGLYPGFGMGAVEILRRLSCCTSFVFLALAAASFVMKLPPSYSRVTFVIAWGCSLVLVPLLRLFVLSLVSRWQWWREPTVLIGSGEWVRWTIRALEDAFSLGYRPVGILSSDPHRRDRSVEGVPVLGGPEWALRLAERGVGVALVGEGDNGGVPTLWLQQHFRQVLMIREKWDLPVERVHVRNLGGVLGVEFTNNLLLWRNRICKRIIDLVFGSVALLFALPLIALGGLAIKLYSPGSIFFCQEREGRDGRPIKVWKLRTMYVDADRRLMECLAANPELRREWETRFKLTNDPRIIPGVGNLLRRWSLDELPQLWNVVKGEMSLVGPRPFPEYHLQQFPAEFRELRRRVRPGLTGMWQVTVRSSGSIEEQRSHDAYYIHNWSIWIDLHILARTVFAVLEGRGAY